MSEGNDVLEALKDRLTTVKKVNGFGHDVLYVDRQFKWPEEIGQRFPALLIVPVGISALPKDLQSNNQMVDRRVSVFMYVYEQHNPSTVLEDLLADVLKCLFSYPPCLDGAVANLSWDGADFSANAFSVIGFSVGYAAPIGVGRTDFTLRHNTNLVGGA